MLRLIIKSSFHIYILTRFKYLSQTSWFNLNTWIEHLNLTWYWFQVESELADLIWLIKQLNMTSRKLNIEIFPIFRLCIIFLIESHKEKHEEKHKDHLIESFDRELW